MKRLLAPVFALAVGACTPALAPRGPDIQIPKMTADTFEMEDGAKLPFRVWNPTGAAASEAPRAVILALHGFNDYSRAWTMPAESWAARGIATYAYDQRGFGRAPGRGLWPGTDALVEDLATTLTLVRKRHPEISVFVAGESMGGAVAMAAMARGRIGEADGAVLVAPAVRGRSTLMFFERWWLWLLFNTIPGFAPTVSGVAVQPSDNYEMLRELSADPLVLKRTRVDSLKGLVDLMDESLAAAPKITMPAMILVGAQDNLIPSGPMATMLENLPPSPPAERTVTTYPAGFHMLLRDRQRARVHADIADWVLAHARHR